MNNTELSRRNFCRMLLAGSVGLITPSLGQSKPLSKTNLTPILPPQPIEHEKNLSMYNLHTGEKLVTTFWQDGQYIQESLQDINYFLRDFRQNEVRMIDPELIELIYTVYQTVDSKQDFHVVSGYRSPKTNEALRRRGVKAAKRSMHLQGKAIDFYLPDRKLSDIRKAASQQKVGGVGYYPQSNFVHLDTGKIRYW